jgi:hypothetical protein
MRADAQQAETVSRSPTDAPVVDVWTFRREVDQSRLRLAAAMVAFLVPEGEVSLDGGRVVVELRVPWWARFGVGMWQRYKRGEVTQRCEVYVPRICGWCPEVVIR